MFNLLKLLSGLSGESNAQTDTTESQPQHGNFTPITSAPAPEQPRHNYMADVIERHERIANRVKK